MKEYEYNVLEDDALLIMKKYKEKGKEYGIVKINKKFIPVLSECIDLMSVSPSVSVKFSRRIEEFLSSRFQELSGIIYEEKGLPEMMELEISKENHRDILKGLFLTNVSTTIKNKKYPVEEIISQLNDIKFVKLK